MKARESAKRMKQVDRVRWRLLSERDRDKLVQITQVRNQKMSTVLRLLASRYNGDVGAYFREACQPNGDMSSIAPRAIDSATLAKIMRQFKPGMPWL